MSRDFAKAFGIGLAVIAVAVGGILYMQRGAHTELQGSILKVRTAPLDERNSVVALDFRVTNTGSYPFMVRTVSVIMEDKDGAQYQGAVSSEVDAQRLFAGVPLLGPKYNTTLLMRERIAPHATADRMVAATFNAPESRLQGRKRFILRIEEMDGPVFDYPEK
ncbi:MAG: hypothetical protein LAP87_21330 [Acidobacteriia bacterium]|nr:hypothetical protein [Terriglobia bacterium]